MRIRRIGVQSVLHYDAVDLDFGEGAPALHVLHGPNEAGKSTLLNLMLDLLFGGSIGEESRDYYDSRSRIEGLLEDPAGTVFSIQRKKNRNRLALITDDDAALTEEQLAFYLGGYDRDRFTLLFGFNHQRLRDGGQSLLQSGGHAGVSLFEAGGGIQYLQNLFGELSQRSGDLLDPSFHARSAKLLNKSWRGYKDAETDVRTGSLRGDEWRGKRDEIESLQRRVEGLREALQTKQREQAKLQRIKRVRGMLSELQSVRDGLLGMGEVRVLSDAWDGRIPQLIAGRRESLKELDGLGRDKQRQVEDIQQIQLDPVALEHAQEIADLNEGLQQYVTRKTAEIPAAQERLSTRLGDAGEILQSIIPGLSLADADSLRIQQADEVRIEQLSEDWKQTRSEVERELREYDDLVLAQERIERALKLLGDSQDISGLQRQIRNIRAQGDIEEAIAGAFRATESKRQELHRLLHSQALWMGDLEQVDALPIPLRETVDGYDRRWRDAETQRSQCERDLESERNKLSGVIRDLETLELAGYVPVETDLVTARKRRNDGWALVKRVWLDGLPADSDEVRAYRLDGPLAEAFESAVGSADEVADLLRRESDRSAQRALLLLQNAQTARDIAELAEKRTTLERAFAQLQSAWQEEWQPCGIQPKPPAEMKDWVATYLRPLVQGLEEVQSKASEHAQWVQNRDAHIAALGLALAELQAQPAQNLGLTALLQHCEEFVGRIEEAERNRQKQFALRKDNQDKLAEQERTLARKRGQLAALEAEWTAFRGRYPNLPERADVANTVVRALRKLFDCVREVAELQSDIARKQTACQAFEQQAEALANRLGERVGNFASLEAWVRHVRDRLGLARTADSSRKRIREELDRIEGKGRDVQSKLGGYEMELKQLQEEYSCATIDSLTDLVEQSVAYKALDNQRNGIERSVIQVGDGFPVTALEAELSELERPDELPVRLTALEDELQDIHNRWEAEKQHLQELQIAFRSLDGSNADAASRAQEAEQYLAEVDQHWNEYLRVELARRLLQRTIDDFREQNQSSVLGRASDMFRRLTLDRYLELTVEHDGRTPYLEAIHCDGTKRRVQQMSDGTRDQLFLSLRLAFVEQHLERSEPLPLIMDDIFINFDDHRTKAALGILHELAGKTQILYFTHHQSVVDAAQEGAEARRVLVHRL